MLVQSRGAPAVAGVPPGWVNVEDYGATSGTVCDDAFAEAVDTKRNVYIPSGTTLSPKSYILTQPVVLNDGQEIRSAGSFYFSTTKIYYRGLTDYCFKLSGTANHVHGITVIQQSGYTPTGGGHFLLGHQTTDTFNSQITNCYSQNAWNGFAAIGHTYFSQINHAHAWGSLNGGYYVDLQVPSGALGWYDLTAYDCDVGLYMRRCDTSKIVGFYAEYCGRGMWLRGDLGPIYQLHLSNLEIEDSRGGVLGNGDVVIGDPSSAQKVSFVTVSQLETYSADFHSMILEQNTTDIMLSQMNLGSHNYIDKGVRNKLTNSVIRSSIGTRTASGIILMGQDAIVSNNHVTQHTTGIQMDSSALYAILQGNNPRSCSTPYNLNATAKASGRGSCNIGMADW